MVSFFCTLLFTAGLAQLFYRLLIGLTGQGGCSGCTVCGKRGKAFCKRKRL